MLRDSVLLLVLFAPLAYGEVPYCDPSDTDAPNSKMLFSLLTTGYNSLARPKAATNATYGLGHAPEYVDFQFRTRNVWDISSKLTTFSYEGVVYLQWVDCRLAYKSRARGGRVSVISMTYDTLLESFGNVLIWMPLPREYNAALEEYADLRSIIITISPEGVLTAKIPQRGTVRCPMNFKDVPFDTHVCRLTFASPEFDEAHMVYTLGSEPAVYNSTEENQEWDIGSFNATQSEKVVLLSEGRNLTYASVNVDFEIERKPFYFVTQGMIPTVLFWFISYVGFFISWSTSSARAAIHMSAILILVNHFRNIFTKLPVISYQTWMADYIVAHLAVTSLHMISFAAAYYSNEKLNEFKKQAIREFANSIKGVDPDSDYIEWIKENTGKMHSTTYKVAVFFSQLDQISEITFLVVIVVVNAIYLKDHVRDI
mmetsp:Transcript_30606/g.66796  ORF Transcript_30606/g.66796 Transcript_30606/m.66796 type:complete len:427 (-) Transcript_30606:90-1370(-)|eukprot:CAMPEP_0118948924 /NCGR_PEP_ID=MMETSP1169-20130426/48678_1 /TAXON_ID=36882 /ORGANISM="Pyramimonas obovata, Strain CCMP722" /LENGTH=426 /DNA_ID=CAMNT_0006895447 /DNA_START=270 /DNA_END=1550 /DNA_ORIENTATION=+